MREFESLKSRLTALRKNIEAIWGTLEVFEKKYMTANERLDEVTKQLETLRAAGGESPNEDYISGLQVKEINYTLCASRAAPLKIKDADTKRGFKF